jgi:SAM-dependent methyltransferase
MKKIEQKKKYRADKARPLAKQYLRTKSKVGRGKDLSITENPYNTEFYLYHFEGSQRSAAIVLDLCFREFYRPKSIVDFGCGTGLWLAAAQRLGVKDALGYEGPWIENVATEPNVKIVVADVGIPLDCRRRFDLAVCLEVAEHLPSDCAANLVTNLCNAADIVLFSAAIPGQGGANHINEQWPSYWAKFFSRKHYRCLDVIRPLIWADERVQPWYRQNTLLFVRKNVDTIRCAQNIGPLDVAHPVIFTEKLAHKAAGGGRN